MIVIAVIGNLLRMRNLTKISFLNGNHQEDPVTRAIFLSKDLDRIRRGQQHQRAHLRYGA